MRLTAIESVGSRRRAKSKSSRPGSRRAASHSTSPPAPTAICGSPRRPTESAGSRPTGQVTEFCHGNHGGQPTLRNVAGPDGNIWFTEPLGPNGFGAIARITPAGVVTEFRTGLTRNSEPFEITVGPDHNLWFTELLGGVGRITTAASSPNSRRGSRRTSSPTGSRRDRTGTSGSPNSAARSAGSPPRARSPNSRRASRQAAGRTGSRPVPRQPLVHGIQREPDWLHQHRGPNHRVLRRHYSGQPPL